MPQPKKPGGTGRKPAARKPAARKPAASRTSRSKPPPAGQRARSAKPAATSAAEATAAARAASAASAKETRREQDQVHAAAASLRDLLSRGVVITADRLQETVDETVRLGRMTREDAEELMRNLVEIGRRQTQDTLAEVEALLGRSAKETRRQARSRLKSVGVAARQTPGGDRALRTVDRVRRAAGLGAAFPIASYEELTTAQVKERLLGLDEAQLRKVREHERRNANRKSVLAAIDKRLS